MQRQIRALCMASLIVISSMACWSTYTSEYYDAALVGKSEEEVMLSLLHLQAMLRKEDMVPSRAVHRVCECIKRVSLEEISEDDVCTLVRWMTNLLKRSKKRVVEDEEQRIHNHIRQFLTDCVLLNAYQHPITKAAKVPCFSDLIVNSLEVCESHVIGDLIVGGDIINPCCEGSGRVGPPGPTGPTGVTGATGAQGPPGTNVVMSNYLFASLFSNGFLGSDGAFIVPGSTDLVNPNEEIAIPLTFQAGLSSGWVPSGGSEEGFVVPETGLYQISYEIYVVNTAPYYGFHAIGWIGIIAGGSSLQKLPNSQSSAYSYDQFPGLNHSFIALLTAGDTLQLRFLNAPEPTNFRFFSVAIAATQDDSVASSLVITKIASV